MFCGALLALIINIAFSRKLVLATALDPRYKMQFFEKEMVNVYRTWLESEVKNVASMNNSAADTSVDEQSPPHTEMSSVLDLFLQVDIYVYFARSM